MSNLIRNAGLARVFVLALALSATTSIAARAADHASQPQQETSMNGLEQPWDNGVVTNIP